MPSLKQVSPRRLRRRKGRLAVTSHTPSLPYPPSSAAALSFPRSDRVRLSRRWRPGDPRRCRPARKPCAGWQSGFAIAHAKRRRAMCPRRAAQKVRRLHPEDQRIQHLGVERHAALLVAFAAQVSCGEGCDLIPLACTQQGKRGFSVQSAMRLTHPEPGGTCVWRGGRAGDYPGATVFLDHQSKIILLQLVQTARRLLCLSIAAMTSPEKGRFVFSLSQSASNRSTVSFAVEMTRCEGSRALSAIVFSSW